MSTLSMDTRVKPAYDVCGGNAMDAMIGARLQH